MTTLKEDYHADMTLAEAEKVVVKILKQVMEETMSTENCEVCVIPADTCKLVYRDAAYIQSLLD